MGLVARYSKKPCLQKPVLTTRQNACADTPNSSGLQSWIDNQNESEDDYSRITENTHVFGHSCWGFVVYRCVYDNNNDWERFKDFLFGWTNQNLREIDVKASLLKTLNVRYFEDSAIFDGTNVSEVRKHFRNWVESDEALSEQPKRGYSSKADKLPQHTTPRYTYCLHVDQDALASVMDHFGSSKFSKQQRTPYVNLIDSTWVKSAGSIQPWTDRELYEVLDPDTEEQEEEENPVGRFTVYSVGWMMVDVRFCMPGTYARLIPMTNGLDPLHMYEH